MAHRWQTLWWSVLISVELEHCFAHRLSCHRVLRLWDSRMLLSACCLQHSRYSLADQMARRKAVLVLPKQALAFLPAWQPQHSHHRLLPESE